MKYIGLSFFLVLFIISWKIFNPPLLITKKVQNKLLYEFSKIIENVLVKKYSQIENVVYNELWAEILSQGRININFSVSYNHIDKETIWGEAFLTKVLKNPNDDNKNKKNITNLWKIDEIKLNKSQIIFKEAIISSSVLIDLEEK